MKIGSVTSSFDIVQFSRSCAPQPCGWRLDYFTTEVVFCQALFWEAFELFELESLSSFSVLAVSLSGWDPSILLSQDRSVCLNAPLGRSLLSQPQNFWTFIGSFQGLPAEPSEVILLSQRLALKYNTTPRDSCQHFLTSFFQFLCGGRLGAKFQPKRTLSGIAQRLRGFSLILLHYIGRANPNRV